MKDLLYSTRSIDFSEEPLKNIPPSLRSAHLRTQRFLLAKNLPRWLSRSIVSVGTRSVGPLFVGPSKWKHSSAEVRRSQEAFKSGWPSSQWGRSATKLRDTKCLLQNAFVSSRVTALREAARTLIFVRIVNSLELLIKFESSCLDGLTAAGCQFVSSDPDVIWPMPKKFSSCTPCLD